jgi:hypothetical protein
LDFTGEKPFIASRKKHLGVMLNFKRFRAGMWLGLLTLLPACAVPHSPEALAPVGPGPELVHPTEEAGTLMVYSERELFGDPGRVGPHSGYRVDSADGKIQLQIKNHLDRFDEGPQRISLPPGKFVVTAPSAHHGKVKVPVVIEERRTTYVYLDGYPHPDAPAAAQTNVVKFSDGQVVGWPSGPTASPQWATGSGHQP